MVSLGISAFYHDSAVCLFEDGKVIAAIPLNQKGVLDVMLMENLPQTIYMKFGNKIVFWLSLIFLTIAFSRKLLR